MKIVVTFDTLEEFEAFKGKEPLLEQPKAREKKAVKKEEATAKEEAAPATAETGEEKVYTKEDVRAVLMKVKRAKGDDVLSGLLGSFGASKLTEVDDSDYPQLIQKAEEVLND